MKVHCEEDIELIDMRPFGGEISPEPTPLSNGNEFDGKRSTNNFIT